MPDTSAKYTLWFLHKVSIAALAYLTALRRVVPVVHLTGYNLVLIEGNDPSSEPYKSPASPLMLNQRNLEPGEGYDPPNKCFAGTPISPLWQPG